MKARIKATGEIVDVDFDKDALANDYPPYRTNEIPSRFFLAEQLECIDIKEKVEPDYWTHLEHQYAGMAMQGILSNNVIMNNIRETKEETMAKIITNFATNFAHALVQKLKEKEEKK